MKTLYDIKIEKLGFSQILTIISKRGSLSAESEKKIVPPVIEYNTDGDIRVLEIKDILSDVKRHPYRIGKEFPKERIADIEVHNLLNHLEHFPTLPTDPKDDSNHPIAELIYGNIVYLRKTADLENKLNTLDYIQRMEFISSILEIVGENFRKEKGLNLDFHSVTKKDVGNVAFLAGPSGIGSCLRKLSFGYHDLIPCDRIARELGSLKSAEKYIAPSHGSIKINDRFKPYVTVLKVGVIGTQHSMLDSGDLMRSSREKIACNLLRKKEISDWETLDENDRNLVCTPFRSGINLTHQEITGINELETNPSCIRLVTPGGVKIAAQYHNDLQAKDKNGNDIDLIIEFDTLAKKGALFLFGLSDPDFDPKDKTYEDLIEKFKSTPKQSIYVEDSEYEGYVLEIPFFRPGQRYTELCVAKDNISIDMISKSITCKPYYLPNSVSTEYSLLRDIYLGLKTTIEKENYDENEKQYQPTS